MSLPGAATWRRRAGASPDPVVTFRLTAERILQVDRMAAEWSITRSEALRRLVAQALGEPEAPSGSAAEPPPQCG